MAASVVRRPHFQIKVSLQLTSRSQQNFICSMSMVEDFLHMSFRKIASELWLLWQLIGPIGLLMEKSLCSFFFIFLLDLHETCT